MAIARSTRSPPNPSATSRSRPERGSGARYTAWPKPMIRRPAATSPRTQSGARSGVPIASSASRARLGAPPCSGPASAPIAEHTASATSAPVEATTRAVNVEALKPWSIVRIMYCSTARTCSGVARTPVVSYRYDAVWPSDGSGSTGSSPAAGAVEGGEDRRRHRRHPQRLVAPCRDVDVDHRIETDHRTGDRQHGAELGQWASPRSGDRAHDGQQRLGDEAQGAPPRRGTPPLGRRREPPVPYEEPHVLERTLPRQRRRVVFSVVEVALVAVHRPDRGLGGDHAVQSCGHIDHLHRHAIESPDRPPIESTLIESTLILINRRIHDGRMTTYVRSAEAARLLGVSPATLYAYVSRGRISAAARRRRPHVVVRRGRDRGAPLGQPAGRPEPAADDRRADRLVDHPARRRRRRAPWVRRSPTSSSTTTSKTSPNCCWTGELPAAATAWAPPGHRRRGGGRHPARNDDRQTDRPADHRRDGAGRPPSRTTTPRTPPGGCSAWRRTRSRVPVGRSGSTSAPNLKRSAAERTRARSPEGYAGRLTRVWTPRPEPGVGRCDRRRPRAARRPRARDQHARGADRRLGPVVAVHRHRRRPRDRRGRAARIGGGGGSSLPRRMPGRRSGNRGRPCPCRTPAHPRIRPQGLPTRGPPLRTAARRRAPDRARTTSAST